MLCSLSDTTPIIVFYYSTTSGWGQQESCCQPPKNPRCTAQKPGFGVLFQKSFTIFEKSLAFWHRIWYYNLADFGKTEYGRLAQLVEHLLDVQEVTGSSPVPSTIQFVLEPDSLRKKGSGIFLFLDYFCFTKYNMFRISHPKERAVAA